MKLANFVEEAWKEGTGVGEPLVDPVTGDELARISSQAIDSGAALEHLRSQGGPALRSLTYTERAELLAKVGDVLSANRAEYFRISMLNLGATEADASFDADGAIYTMKYYAKVGRALAEGKMLKEGPAVPLSKTGVFAGQHFLTPLKGAAIFINAFNFPAWGFCEKAAPAWLSGVPVMLKPASPTAWLAHRMVEDIVKAGILPRGALSVICGSARDLLDQVREGDVVCFTGSAETAMKIRSHPSVLKHSVRVNIEADSINSAILGPDVAAGSDLFQQVVQVVIREMTLKAGQKCTAIRRIFAPERTQAALGEAISAALAAVKVGNPRNAEVKMGPVVNKAQQASCFAGVEALRKECTTLYGGGREFRPLDADAQRAAFVPPTLLACADGFQATAVHEVEVFGPVATLVSYHSADELAKMARLGRGSLVGSIFSDDAGFVRNFVLGAGDLHGRILVVDSTIGNQHTGHGNVVPSCLHGGPGRAGGGEELAGLRALALYHRRFVVQGPPSAINGLAAMSSDASLLYG